MVLKLQIVLIFSVLRSQPAFSALEPQIVGGRFASIYKFPHTAFLKLAAKVRGTNHYVSYWVCGASILTDRVLLTAGHCLEPGKGLQATAVVIVGTHEKGKGKVYVPTYLVVHHSFDASKFANDIGLLGLSRSIKLCSTTKRVAVMRSPPYHERGLVAGWGYASQKQNVTSKYLKYVAQNLMNHSLCEQILLKLPDGVLCGMDSDMYELRGYAEPGDPGSALVVRNYIQIGIVSFKYPYDKKHITVYTDTGHFYDWIKNTTLRLHCLYA